MTDDPVAAAEMIVLGEAAVLARHPYWQMRSRLERINALLGWIDSWIEKGWAWCKLQPPLQLLLYAVLALAVVESIKVLLG